MGSGALLADPKIHGTIPISKQSMRQYPILTKLTFSEAMEVAAREGKGKVIAAKLENEDGYLVYAVKLATSATSITELNIDAGSMTTAAEERGDSTPFTGHLTSPIRLMLERLHARLEAAAKEAEQQKSDGLRQMAGVARSAVSLMRRSVELSCFSTERRLLLTNHRKLTHLAGEADPILRNGLVGIPREETENKETSVDLQKTLYSLYIEFMEIVELCDEIAVCLEALPSEATC